MLLIADIDNGAYKSMNIRMIIIFGLYTEMTLKGVFLLHSILVPTISQSDFISRSWLIKVFYKDRIYNVQKKLSISMWSHVKIEED